VTAPGPAAGGRGAGFTLLETLVALAILGIVMSTVYAVFGNGLRAASRDEDRLLLGLVAQNLLARSRLDLDPSGGALSGDIDGGLRWRIESEPYELPEDILPEAPGAFDEPLLAPREDDGTEAPATAGDGFGARSAMARESGRARDAGRGDDAGPEDGAGTGDAEEPGEPREPLRLRRILVVVEKGDQRFELSSLALEPPREARGR
jgi:type II secretion system protein I